MVNLGLRAVGVAGFDQQLFLPCAAGVEPWLAEEAHRILAEWRGLLSVSDSEGWEGDIQAGRGGVRVCISGRSSHEVSRGSMLVAMQLNLESRLAQRVLWQLERAPYRDEGDLYAAARRINWPAWLTSRQTLRVDVTAHRSPLRSLNFAALRIKDAVCDTLRDACGERPSVDTRNPDLSLVLHIAESDATLYVDTSGEPLFKRGWREDKGEAPLKETLAAALLAAAGWQGRPEDGALLDPCCGSGTIAIEAAQIACGIAPGMSRRFAFERLLPFAEVLPTWKHMQQTARARVRTCSLPIYAGDVAFRLTDFAQRNAQRAGVLQAIEFKTADALQRMPVAERGTLILNPPYGERMGAKGTQAARDEAPADFYSRLAAHWKRHYGGWTAWVLSPDMKLPSAMRLKEARRIPMWNGPIECRLFRFDLVTGSMRPPQDGPVEGL